MGKSCGESLNDHFEISNVIIGKGAFGKNPIECFEYMSNAQI
jgi:hypothetical protein